MQIKYRKGHNIHCFKKRRANIKTFLVPRLLKILFEQMGNTWKYLFIILFKGTAWNNTLILWVLKACFWLLQVYFSTYYVFFLQSICMTELHIILVAVYVTERNGKMKLKVNPGRSLTITSKMAGFFIAQSPEVAKR